MFRNNRKTIAVFIFRMTHYFQKTLCKGISEQAYKMGYNVAFFSSFGAYNDNISFSEGEKIIKTLPNYNNYAGIVLALDTMDIEGFKEDLIKECRKLTCPVVCIREESDGFYNFNINEKNSIESVIRHFVEYHKYRDICFLTGRENDISAQQRLACFLRVMEENGIEVDIEKQVRYGNYWKNDGEPACKQFIDEYGRWPEAIICANDYMAISVCNELIERGIRVPEDIAVGGFDGIEETKVYATPITSAGVPSHEMGAESIVLIDRIINGEECEERKLFDLELIVNESCGCNNQEIEELIKDRMEFFEQTERMQTDNFFTTYLMIDLEGVKSMKEMADAVENNIHCLGPYIRFHMCLCQGIDETRTDRLEGFTDEMQLYMTMERDKHVVISGDTFHKDFLLPDSVITEEPQIYYFLPLHFKETIFGYTAISFENGDAYKQNYQSWMIGLGNAIENISIHRKMQHLIDNLQDLYIRDELTGLYNRRGFEKFGEELFYKAKTENKYVYVIALDLDGLKTINDDFGHAHGDIAIKAVAEAIKNASINHEISARMGGDEYSVIGIADMNAEKYAIDFLRIFNKHIDMVNRDFAAEYVIGASYGTSYKNPEDDTELEFHMNKSDDAMYQMKASRKER